MPEISVQRLDLDLPLPQFAHAGDAGVDLYAREDTVLAPNGGRALMPTGIAIAIPLGYAGFVLPRSGLALHNGISVVNAPGLIDSHYRGELKVILINHGSEPFVIARGDRVAQLVLAPVLRAAWREVDELDETERGSGGFGSTGGHSKL